MKRENNIKSRNAHLRECRSGQTGQDEVLVAHAYAGSNPVSRMHEVLRAQEITPVSRMEQ